MADGKIFAKFVSSEGVACASPLEIPLTTTTNQLQVIVNALLDSTERYQFHVNEFEVTDTLQKTLQLHTATPSTEHVMEIRYEPQAVFRVRTVTRCSATVPGHTEALINASFSHDGTQLASGSGDTIVRFWDLTTESPLHVCKGHRQWVLVTSWHPSGKYLASACKKGDVCVWDPKCGKQKCKALSGHKKYVGTLAWQPIHCAQENGGVLLASGSKDTTIKVWEVTRGQCVVTLSSHTQGVTAIRWSGDDLIYSASQDRTIKVWRPKDGVLCRTLQGHAHWVNTMALNTDYAIRIGNWDPSLQGKNETGVASDALSVYKKFSGSGEEFMVSGSDDFTMFLWSPASSDKPLCRMTGHQQIINQVMFSPNGRRIASASFDKSVKVWDGRTGKYISTLRGHVKAVYQVSWSADNKLLVSGSADSTVKVWCMKTFALLQDLAGHADEVYTVDWSPCGSRVVSGGKDRVLKLWRS